MANLRVHIQSITANFSSSLVLLRGFPTLRVQYAVVTRKFLATAAISFCSASSTLYPLRLHPRNLSNYVGYDHGAPAPISSFLIHSRWVTPSIAFCLAILVTKYAIKNKQIKLYTKNTHIYRKKLRDEYKRHGTQANVVQK